MPKASGWVPPAPSEDQEEGRQFPNFLSTGELPKKGSITGTITHVRETPDLEFSDFAIEVKIARLGERTIGVRYNQPNHRILANICGRRNWVGQKIRIEKKHSKKYKKDFVSILED